MRRMKQLAPAEARTVATGQTVTGMFASETAARDAVKRLERAGMPPDRIGFVRGNVRQAREAAGSYSPQGALVGALVGIALVVGYVLFGGDQVAPNLGPVAIGVGGLAIVGGLALIGWLAGRARLFKSDEFAELEDDVASGDILVTVVCDTARGVEQTRSILESAGATDVAVEDSAEAV